MKATQGQGLREDAKLTWFSYDKRDLDTLKRFMELNSWINKCNQSLIP